VWQGTAALEADPTPLAGCDALWCVPGSPYASMAGALAAIRRAREQARPFLGTCGGFQHALIEYARNVLGLDGADHAESNPEAALPLIAPLACGLVEAQGAIRLLPGSRIRAIYGEDTIGEAYNCRYGLNPAYQARLTDGALRITGVDADGEVRVVELTTHPFFIATLFQPERAALAGRAHPLIQAFVQAAAVPAPA
jgi:CTP synthase (UTP-ammonia lyase)